MKDAPSGGHHGFWWELWEWAWIDVSTLGKDIWTNGIERRISGLTGHMYGIWKRVILLARVILIVYFFHL